MLEDESFIPNDTILGSPEEILSLITGPNMAGKSTYMRQVALIVLMSQIGSFVPAKSSEIGVVDRIFTRIGASDDLATGQSTFMMEMIECQIILNGATGKSLVVMDEVGRGTSTYDGISIARALVEYLYENIKCKTLFSTHYHELTNLEHQYQGIKNYTVAIKEKGEDIIFLRKVIPGRADRSYGIHVAKLAGFPADILMRAESILQGFEKGVPEAKSEVAVALNKEEGKGQLTFFPSEKSKANRILSKDKEDPIVVDSKTQQTVDDIKGLDLLNMTPLDAMNKLHELKKKLE